MKRYVLGIDAGGTGIRLALSEAGALQIVGETEGASDPLGGPEPLDDLLGRLLDRVGPDEVVAVQAGITKVSRTGVKDAWHAYLSRRFPGAVCGCDADFVIGFHGALAQGIGIAALAGTGSVFYGEDGHGRSARVGGRGWEFGDEGSGAWLTTEMVRRTLRALDGLEKPSALTQAVCTTLGTAEPAALGEAARQSANDMGRGYLVPLALELALGGNSEAKNLFLGAAGWIAVQVRATAEQIELPADESVKIAMVGGLWKAGNLLRDPFASVLRRYLPAAEVVDPDSEPVIGAVRMALRSAASR